MKRLFTLLVFAVGCKAGFVSACNPNNGGNSPGSCTLSVTSGNYIYVVTSTNATNGPPSVTDTNGDTFTSIYGPIDNTSVAGGHDNLQIFRAKCGTTNASESVTATWANNFSWQFMIAAQYSGLTSTTPEDQFSNDIYDDGATVQCSGGCVLPDNPVVTTFTDEIILGIYSWGNIGTSTVTASGYTVRNTYEGSHIGISLADKSVSPVGSYNATGTLTGASTTAIGVDMIITLKTTSSVPGFFYYPKKAVLFY